MVKVRRLVIGEAYWLDPECVLIPQPADDVRGNSSRPYDQGTLAERRHSMCNRAHQGPERDAPERGCTAHGERGRGGPIGADRVKQRGQRPRGHERRYEEPGRLMYTAGPC